MGIADYIKTKLPYWPNCLTYPLLKLNCFKGLCYGRSYQNYGKVVDDTTPEQKLVDIANYAIKNVPYYRKRYSGIEIKSKADFETKIGLIDKNEVLANWDDFVADGVDMTRCYVESTGGTSGKPMRFLSPKNRYIHAMYFWHKQLKRFGWDYDTVAVIRNHHLPENRVYMTNPVMKQLIFDGFRLNDEYCHEIWATMRKKRVRYLYCYPSAAYTFLKSCRVQNLDTSFIKACFLTSEQIMEYQREFIQDKLGIDILGSYGHSEKLCLAGTCPEKFLYHIDEQYGYTELIDAKGQPITDKGVLGEVVGTTYSNRFFPLLRYRTGDYASYADADCGSHEGERLLTPIEGRWDASLISRADGSHTSLTALNVHGSFNDHINGMQYVQSVPGRLLLMIVKGYGYTDADHEFISAHIAEAMGGAEYVEVRYVDKLILQPNGKFLPLIKSDQCVVD